MNQRRLRTRELEHCPAPPVQPASWSLPASTLAPAMPQLMSVPGATGRYEVSQPGDPLELEAEAVAARVMASEAQDPQAIRPSLGRLVQRKCACGGSGGSEGEEKCAECAAEESEEEQRKRGAGRVQRVAAGAVGTRDVAGAIAPALSGDGSTLDRETRAFMEPRFGHQFGHVRVHTDGTAAASAKLLGARAYTVGQHLVFGAGEFAPDTSAGRRLLAHELTHVVQQGSAPLGERVLRQVDPAAGPGQDSVEGADVAIPDITVSTAPREVVAYGRTLSLEGKTNAKFSSTSTLKSKGKAAGGCEDCKPPACVHVTGTLVLDFTVATSVTLPKASDFPGLTACERQKVRDAIKNVIAPHEQEHVTAFHTYDGRVSEPFDATLCQKDLKPTVESRLQTTQTQRQAKAQALSDALDPFNFEVDLTCEEGGAQAGAPPPGDEEDA